MKILLKFRNCLCLCQTTVISIIKFRRKFSAITKNVHWEILLKFRNCLCRQLTMSLCISHSIKPRNFTKILPEPKWMFYESYYHMSSGMSNVSGRICCLVPRFTNRGNQGGGASLRDETKVYWSLKLSITIITFLLLPSIRVCYHIFIIST